MEKHGISIETYLKELKNLNNSVIYGDGIISRFDDIKKTICCNSYLIDFEIDKKLPKANILTNSYVKFIGKIKNNKLLIHKYFVSDSKEHSETIISDIELANKKLEKMSQCNLAKAKNIPFLLDIAIIHIGNIEHTISDTLLNRLPNKSSMIDITSNLEYNLIKTLDLLIKYKNHSALCVICEDVPNVVVGTCGIDLIKFINTNYNLLPPILVLKNQDYPTSFEKYTNSVFNTVTEMESFLEKTHERSREFLENSMEKIKKMVDIKISNHRKNLKHFQSILAVINRRTKVDRNLIQQKIEHIISQKRKLYCGALNKMLLLSYKVIDKILI